MGEIYSGIYCIENTQTGKRYIGQSKDIISRLNRHRNELKRGKHRNVLLQNSFNKYGLLFFKFYILELCPLDSLNDKEIEYISKFDSYHNGYNLSPGGDPGNNSTGKPIKQYDLDGNYLRTWNNAAEASRFYSVDRSMITHAVRKGTKILNSQWCYEDETIDTYYKRNNQKAIAQYDLSGNLVKVYKSLTDAVNNNKGFKKDNIQKSINGKWRKTAYGYIWKYVETEVYYA